MWKLVVVNIRENLSLQLYFLLIESLVEKKINWAVQQIYFLLCEFNICN